MDTLSSLVQVSFFAVLAAAVWRYLRRPGRIELALVTVFSTTAALFLISLLDDLSPGVSATLRPLAVTLLVAQPMLVFWLVGMLQPVPRWSMLLVFAGFVVAAAVLIIPPQIIPPAALFLAFYFVLVEGAAAALFFKESQHRFGVARLRLALAGLATALFGTSIVIASVGAAAAGPGVATEPGLLVAARVAALAAALGYIAAFVPPGWLRTVGQRAVAFDLARRLVMAQAGTEPELLWRNLASAARDILGTRSVSIADAQGGMLADTRPEQPRPEAGATGRTVSLPIMIDGVLQAQLVAELEGEPLFVEDDLEVLALLGLMTVRTVEREQAVLRLGEANRQLAESAAVRASEARFRALLEAHPNAVLAVDPDGRVNWATGPTAELFGRSSAELDGVPLADLIELDALALAAFARADGDRHLETRGRRVDGTAFPADVAITSFNLDDRRYELIVVSDASWRHEANLLRDRFLGILSHELRTPITSIYGGTQLLLRRSERLDDESRQDQMRSIATESERLLRIIENLLVLARVERGADFFEPQPVVVRPVIAELISRERPLWPEMTISVTVAAGLPLVAADEEYLSLILRNLLSNAAKYAGPRSTVEVLVEQAQADEVVFLVCDDGPGVVAEEAEQLFTLYFRSATSTSAQGAGIGLFVCRGLVSAMNGRIWARSRPTGGAEFGFALPVYDEAADIGEATDVVEAIDIVPPEQPTVELPAGPPSPRQASTS